MNLKLNKKFSRHVILDLFKNITGTSPNYDLVLFLSHNELRGTADTSTFTSAGKESIQDEANNIFIQASKIIDTSGSDSEIMAGVPSSNGEITFLSQKYIMKTPSEITDNDGFLYEYLYVVKEMTSDYKGKENEVVYYNVVTLALVEHGEITGSYDRYGDTAGTKPNLSGITDITIIAQARPTTTILAKTTGEGFEGGALSQEEKEFKLLIKI